MRIRTQDGAEYPFSELAEYSINRGIIAINHLNRKREIKVEASQTDVSRDLPPILAEIKEKVLPRILSQVHGVRASFEGQSRDQAKMARSIQKAFPLALIGMFILVVLVFRSYVQAILIFSLIPIGILGAIWGHGIQGIQVNMLSVYGIIALSGIIINDSIVFIDQINRLLRAGQSVFDAVHNAGIARLRPILLTTLTTAFGLAPLIFETSRQAQFLIPMAVSVAWGLVFGTAILLIILPSSFLAFNRIRVIWSELVLKKTETAESVEPAVRELKQMDVQYT
jgi:multidrug efflux pump subunit AcrB